MTLTPGDRSIISVNPWRGQHSTTWSCARCPEQMPPGSAWSVTRRRPDGSIDELVVGPLCARELMPVRATIDLVALERRKAEFPALTSLVEHVKASRRSEVRYELRLRSADVHLLAEMYDETPPRFAMRLRDAGVLLGL